MPEHGTCPVCGREAWRWPGGRWYCVWPACSTEGGGAGDAMTWWQVALIAGAAYLLGVQFGRRGAALEYAMQRLAEHEQRVAERAERQ
jgi:hypothetical protein